MRALLIVNPAATTTTARTREVISRALGSELKLDVATTERRGHAAELAGAAEAEGFDGVVSLGGDGTVNECVNGLLGNGAHEGVPWLAVVPGGSTNVLSRTLGLPEDPVEATGVLLDALREGRQRRIGLGRADERWFTVNAGLGLDADVVAAVERQRAEGARSTHALYLREVVRSFYLGDNRRSTPLTLERPGAEPEPGLWLTIVQNTAPWTYVGRRPIHPSPGASFDTGLDVFALRKVGTVGTLRHAAQLLSASGRSPRGRAVVSVHDAPQVIVHATRPVRYQVDGEHLGVRSRVTFTAVPRALGILV